MYEARRRPACRVVDRLFHYRRVFNRRRLTHTYLSTWYVFIRIEQPELFQYRALYSKYQWSLLRDVSGVRRRTTREAVVTR